MHNNLPPYSSWELRWVIPIRRPSQTTRAIEDAKRMRVVNGSGPSTSPLEIAEHASDVDIGALFGENEMMDLGEGFFDDLDQALLHESVNLDGTATISEVGMPQESNLADKGVPSHGGAWIGVSGGGVVILVCQVVLVLVLAYQVLLLVVFLLLQQFLLVLLAPFLVEDPTRWQCYARISMLG